MMLDKWNAGSVTSKKKLTFPTFYCVVCVTVLIMRNFQSSTGVTASLQVHKYSTRIVRTKYGPIRGVMVHIHPPVEAFLGVPYASPPVGSLRYMPPVTPSDWKNIRLADRFGPVCPQNLPDISNLTQALLEHPRSRILHLERLLPLLVNQSEDCLYLNLYVPKSAINAKESFPCVVYVHGDSFEWNSGNPYDGSVLASNGQIIVVTINFRLGILGFLKTGTTGGSQGNFGLMDLIAGLHWLRENLPAFGGNPEKLTLMGHGTGAALINFVAVSPVSKDLLNRAIFLSGSALSPWALQRNPLTVKRSVASHANCHLNLTDDDLAPCLRRKSLKQLLSIQLNTPRFLSGFAPFTDGSIVVKQSYKSGASGSSSSPTVVTSPGHELANFPNCDLLFGLTNTESYLDLTAQDLRFGLNETRRDRILRTYVRNAFYFHLNEIFSTLKNEYTDWERPIQSALSVRDSTLDVLSDGHTAAPLIRIGYLHSLYAGKTFFLHFHHQTEERDFPMVAGSVHGEELQYIFGLPLISGGVFFPRNYTFRDVTVSKALMHYISNFVYNGDPNNSPQNNQQKMVMNNIPYWDMYDTINQLFLEIGDHMEMKNHYRGHKMSLWLNLIPQLHRHLESDYTTMTHHHFLEGDEYYEGIVRPQSSEPPAHIPMVKVSAKDSVETAAPVITTSNPKVGILLKQNLPTTNTTSSSIDCMFNVTSVLVPVNDNPNNNHHKNRIQDFVNSQYENYKVALVVTIAIGCCLILLNVVIFIGIYRRQNCTLHWRRNSKHDSSDALLTSCTCKCDQNPAHFGDLLPNNYCSASGCNVATDLTCNSLQFASDESMDTKGKTHVICCLTDKELDEEIHSDDSSIPAPPPPPKSLPPRSQQSGILRTNFSGGYNTTPRVVKKRVQIQEISV